MGCIFNPHVLHQIARAHLELPHQEMVCGIARELARAYPGHLETREEWMLSLAGGAMGIMTVLHGSLSEYVLIFGTPIGTEGFSGRYHIGIFDFLLAGEMWTYTEDAFRTATISRPGDMAYLGPGQAKGFRLKAGTWMLEYGRGPVVTALPFALGDALLAFDGPTIARTLKVYGRLVLRELRQGKV